MLIGVFQPWVNSQHDFCRYWNAQVYSFQVNDISIFVIEVVGITSLQNRGNPDLKKKKRRNYW